MKCSGSNLQIRIPELFSKKEHTLPLMISTHGGGLVSHAARLKHGKEQGLAFSPYLKYCAGKKRAFYRNKPGNSGNSAFIAVYRTTNNTQFIFIGPGLFDQQQSVNILYTGTARARRTRCRYEQGEKNGRQRNDINGGIKCMIWLFHSMFRSKKNRS